MSLVHWNPFRGALHVRYPVQPGVSSRHSGNRRGPRRVELGAGGRRLRDRRPRAGGQRRVARYRPQGRQRRARERRAHHRGRAQGQHRGRPGAVVPVRAGLRNVPPVVHSAAHRGRRSGHRGTQGRRAAGATAVEGGGQAAPHHRQRGIVVPFVITVRIEGGEAPAPQGARRENTRSIRPTSNTAARDASAAECGRIYDTGHLALAARGELPLRSPDAACRKAGAGPVSVRRRTFTADCTWSSRERGMALSHLALPERMGTPTPTGEGKDGVTPEHS